MRQREVVRMIQGQLVVGTLVSEKSRPKSASVRPRPSKPVYGSRLPPSLEKE